jgi:hypothetical protein
MAFAELATHGWSRAVGEFSIRHQITGAGAWTASFVLMAVSICTRSPSVLHTCALRSAA